MIKTTRTARPLLVTFGLLLSLCGAAWAQVPGPQQLVFAGLRSVAQQGQFNAVATDAAGNLILLLDQGDGIRLLKTDSAASTVLALAALGAAGDQGLAMALDPSGNVYVTGQSISNALSGTSGAAFVHPVGTTANSFVAKFDATLTLQWVTFGGSGRAPASAITATADAVFITGLIYGNGLPVTPGGITQAPAEGSNQNGSSRSSPPTVRRCSTRRISAARRAIPRRSSSPPMRTTTHLWRALPRPAAIRRRSQASPAPFPR